MSNLITELLIQKNFSERTDAFFLSNGSSIFTLEKEETLNERYTFMNYLIETKAGVLSGKLYTNSFERFNVSLSKLIGHYESLVLESLEIESKIDFISNFLSNSSFQRISADTYIFHKASGTKYELIFNENRLQIVIEITSNENKIKVFDKSFLSAASNFEIESALKKLKTKLKKGAFEKSVYSNVC